MEPLRLHRSDSAVPSLREPAVPETAVPEPSVAPAWDYGTLAGRITELRASLRASPRVPRGPVSAASAGSEDPRDEACGSLTPAARILRDAQEEGEPAAWISTAESNVYPPDLADFGVDLEALLFVRVRGWTKGARAAEQLLRSGAFGLVVLDLEPETGGRGSPQLPAAALMRLAALCRKHQAALLCLTRATSESSPVGSLVSLRAEGTRARRSPDGWTAGVRAVKDKRHGRAWRHEEVCRGPDGLR